MGSRHSSPSPSVLILKADKLYAETLRHLTLAVLPRAVIRVAPCVASASVALAAEPVDLLITGVGSSLGGDVFELLASVTEAPMRIHRVLVVTSNRENRPLAVLRRLEIQGVFDSASEAPAQFKSALRLVMAGGSYWSVSILDQLRRYALAPNSPARLLTDTEQLVLSLIGDGSDDTEAATQLGLSPATVSTVRRNLHRKLGVQHRGELVRVAAQAGYVRFTPTGIVRPGFALLAAAYRRRIRNRGESVAA